MGIFDRLLGSGDRVRAARRAELRGDLSRAAELWSLAGRPEESARVMLLRGDSELDAQKRIQHYLQAAAVAPRGHSVQRDARLRRAHFIVTLASSGPISAALRRDVMTAAADLEELGEPSSAADAYRLVGDEQGEARALTLAGEVDKLETLLSSEQERERRERDKRSLAHEVELLMASGRRREAAKAIEEKLAAEKDDHLLKVRLETINLRKLKGPVLKVTLAGKATLLVIEDEDVVLGRSEGHIRVRSQAISRQHLRLTREADRVVAFDLNSRNGTIFRGVRMMGSVAVDDRVELKLGNEVPLQLFPSSDIPGCTVVEVAGKTYLVSFGAVTLPVPGGAWEIGRGDDEWYELRTGSPPAFLKDASLAATTTLLSGDAIAEKRGAPPILKVVNGDG